MARPAPKLRPTEPVRLCVGEQVDECRTWEQVEALFSQPLEVLEAVPTPAGTQGALLLTLQPKQGETLLWAKWRGQHSRDWLNEPYRELAAYAVQRLLLEPEDYVIPPTRAHCLVLPEVLGVADSARFRQAELEQCPQAECVFGYLVYWVSGALSIGDAREQGVLPRPDTVDNASADLYDATRFESDATYRNNLANLNLVTYAVRHGDPHASQFIVYEMPPHIFLIDNSIAFESIKNPLLSVREDWSQWLVPGIPADAAERVLSLTHDQVARLSVVAQFECAGDSLRRMPAGAPFSTAHNLRWRDGQLQLGLNDTEVQGLWERILRLQRMLERGEVNVF